MNYFLIPVFPTAGMIKALYKATHRVPFRSVCVQLPCRNRQCGDFGRTDDHRKIVSRRGVDAWRFVGQLLLEAVVEGAPCSPFRSQQQEGRCLHKSYMPSSGDLTVKNARSVVHGIETTTQHGYNTMERRWRSIKRFKGSRTGTGKQHTVYETVTVQETTAGRPPLRLFEYLVVLVLVHVFYLH